MLSILKYLGKPQKLLPIANWLNLKQAYRKSYGNHQLQDQQDIQQQAIIAYHVIENIRQLGQKPYVPFNRQSIINRVFSKAHLWNNKIGYESGEDTWILKQKNIDIVWQGFNDSIGAKVNTNIWCQRRFKEVARYGRIVLMPSQTTGKIFKQLIISYKPIVSEQNRQNNQKQIEGEYKAQIITVQKSSFVIAGQKGTGKSFAYLIYDYLSKFILSYRIAQSQLIQQRVRRFHFFVPQIEFKSIKKIIYYPLRQKQRFIQIYDHIALQTSQPLFKNSAQSDLIMFQNLLREIKLDFRSKNGIQLMFIIDEYNFYYSCFIEMSKKGVQKEATTDKTATDKESYQLVVKAHSRIISSVAANFKFLIFNSSQAIEGEIITTWNRGRGAKYFNLYQHGATNVLDFNINYTQDLDTIYGQIALYKILWTELCSHFLKVNCIDSLATNIQFKKAFLEIFGLTQECMFSGMNEVPNSLQFFLNQWEIDVRHLNIREVITDRITTQKLFSLIKASKPNSHVQLANQLLVIKKIIETRRFNQVKSILTSFYDKSMDDKTDLARFKIICLINYVAYLAKQKISKMENESFKPKLQTKLQEQNYTVQKKPLKSNMYQKKNRVLVDFTVLLPDGINDKQPKADIQEKKTIIKQISSFIKQVGIGYPQRDNFKKCIFIISPKQLWQMTLLIDMDFTKYSASQLDLLIKKIRLNRLFGDHMHSLYYQFFSKNFNFQFLINRFTVKGEQKTKRPLKYNVSNCIAFRTRSFAPNLKNLNKNDDKKQSRPQEQFDQLILNQYLKPEGNQLNLPEQLEDILEAAQEHIGNYVLGYPVYADKSFAFKNPYFDFVLIKAQKITAQTSNKYKIHFVDLGVGKVLAKSRETKKIELLLLIQQFKKIEPFENIPDGNIEFKHIILAPKSQIAVFQKQIAEQKDQKQMNIVMQQYWTEKPLSLKRIIGKNAQGQEIRVDYGFKMTYEIRFANYDVKQAHIKIPTDQNVENLLFSTMRRVSEELKITESDAERKKRKNLKKP